MLGTMRTRNGASAPGPENGRHERKSQEPLSEVQMKKAPWFFKVPMASAGFLGLVLVILFLNRSTRQIAVEPDSRFSSKPASIQKGRQTSTPYPEKKLAVTRCLSSACASSSRIAASSIPGGLLRQGRDTALPRPRG
jgi:hypothetical protein